MADEGWFKTAIVLVYTPFVGTPLGVYRWLVLSLIAYILAHWAYLSINSTDLPDWEKPLKLH